MFHLGWFGEAGCARWNGPDLALYDWRRPEIYQDVARICERAKFDMVIFADTLAVPQVMGSRDMYLRNGQSIRMDPVPVVAMMSAVTSRLGFASTLSTLSYPPFTLARMLSTIDHMTRGRIAWNVVTSANEDAAKNFGHAQLGKHDERYDQADEYIEVCRALWESWEPDALIQDRENHVFADPAKVHAIDYKGKYYSSQGPLTIVPSPQGRPVICVAGTSKRGLQFGGRHGDMAIGHMKTISDMKKAVNDLRTAASNAGRDPMSIKISFSVKPVMGPTDSIARAVKQWQAENADVHEGLATLSYFTGTDLFEYDIDKPLPKGIKTNAMQSVLTDYYSMPEGYTLRDFGRDEALSETYAICGSYEHVADELEHAQKESGCDMFHFRSGTTTNIGYLSEIATRLVPVLQRRGLVRKEYAGATLREHLQEF